MEPSGEYLTLDEALPIIGEAITDTTILVGGQAVNLWAVILGIETAAPFLTRDIDFVGTRQDAQLANTRISLPHELYLASMDDSSISSAVISVNIPGHTEATPIDYLMTLYGLDYDEISKSAIDIGLDGIVIRVIHPLILMQSKLCNLDLESKQTPEGIEQARLSVEIANAFIASVIKSGEVTPRKVLNLVNLVIKISKGSHSAQALRKYGIDTMKAIPIDALKSSVEPSFIKFIESGLPLAEKQMARFRT